MSLTLRKGVLSDLSALCRMYEAGIRAMDGQGIDQWRWGWYPSEEILARDIRAGEMYVLADVEELCAAFVLNSEQPDQYANLCWYYGVNPAVLHRLMVDPQKQRRGVGREAMAQVLRLSRERRCDTLRLDTYLKNQRAMDLYLGLGMREAGRVRFDQRPTPFPCYEMPLAEDCPLLPLAMRPSYRAYPELPWGGNKLKTLYGKDIPNDRTGESLEISVIPGHVSHAASGEGLDELLTRLGEGFRGTQVKEPFPLLLKLLDAKDTLSVQVHPGDDYAGAHENGKLGKTEAWVILQADPGAELVYGLTPGVTRPALEAAAREGAAIEKYLRRMKVQEGDVCFIPAGCVHAIGAGVFLYEIQQSSDVTYRFYDWDRIGPDGKKRSLQIQQAIDVADLSFQPDPKPRAPGTGFMPLLRNPVFELDRLHAAGELPIAPDPRRFSFLTVLHDLRLAWDGASLDLHKGDSVFLPARRPHLRLEGVGEALLASPTVGDAQGRRP